MEKSPAPPHPVSGSLALPEHKSELAERVRPSRCVVIARYIRGLSLAALAITCAAPLSAADLETFEKSLLGVDRSNAEEALDQQKKRETNPNTSSPSGSDPAHAAETFFEMCANGKSQEALKSAAPILQSRLDVLGLESALGRLGLKDRGRITWRIGASSPYLATVHGSFAQEGGKLIPLLVQLVRDGPTWRVYSACLRPAKAPDPLVPIFAPARPAGEKPAPTLPDQQAIREFVQRDLRSFAEIQDSDSFRELYRERGGRARKRPIEIWETLARLRDRDLTPRTALGAPIHFDTVPSIRPDGVCTAEIHLDFAPLQLEIWYYYVLTVDGWRFGGKGTQVVPNSGEVERLARETLLRFEDAIRRRSFAEFHKSVSEKWKADVEPEQMEKAFRAFIEKEIVLDGLASAPIIITSGPDEDSDSLLQFSGRCQTTPPTIFTLKHWYENGDWRLFGIDVSLSKL